MALNNSGAVIRDRRRRMVASLMLRKLTQREIQDQLSKNGIMHYDKKSDTYKPFSLGTINGDIQALREEWRESALQDTEEHHINLWAEYEELKRAGWAKGELNVVKSALDAQRDMLGLTYRYKQSVTAIFSPEIQRELDSLGINPSDVVKEFESMIKSNVAAELAMSQD